MPKFYKQNKKKIDPRYFLSETTAHEDDISEGFLSKTFKPSEKNNISKYMDRLSGDNILDYLEKNKDEVASTEKYLTAFLKALGSKANSSKFEDFIVKGFFPNGVIKSDALKKLIYDFRGTDFNAKDLTVLKQKISELS